MSDFLKSLVARQLGEAASVRPRLAGRFEPPPDAFAPDARAHPATWGEPDAEPPELFFEVETQAAPARGAAPTQAAQEDSPTPAPRREVVETSSRVVVMREPRDDSQTVFRQERGTTSEPERAHDSTAPPSAAESQTGGRQESDAHARPKSVVPASGEESEPAGRLNPTNDHAPFVTRARTRGDGGAPPPRETQQTAARGNEPAPRTPTYVRPVPALPLARGEAAATPRASDEDSSLARAETTRAHEPPHARDDAAETHDLRRARRGRESSGTIEPQPARRRARQAAADEVRRGPAQAQPTINVTIGRVEVRATPAPAPAPRRAESASPRMSLDDYLRRRNGEVRE